MYLERRVYFQRLVFFVRFEAAAVLCVRSLIIALSVCLNDLVILSHVILRSSQYLLRLTAKRKTYTLLQM